MPRFQVTGTYTDPPQVVIDIIDAEDDDAATAAIEHARGGATSGYTADEARDIEDEIAFLQDLQQRSAKTVAQDVIELAAQYAHYHEATS